MQYPNKYSYIIQILNLLIQDIFIIDYINCKTHHQFNLVIVIFFYLIYFNIFINVLIIEYLI